jgi:hydrogenase maturation protein HypF
VTVRTRARVEGTVQGVGFRPHVFRLASEMALGGFVRNDEHGVLLEVEGSADAVEAFLARVTAEAPPLAHVERMLVEGVAATGRTGFAIERSAVGGAPDALVSFDAATCEDCLRELFDPADRRFRHPFVNCTNCGPRFTIVTGVPYDRLLTTMAGFAMCAACRAEYDDPRDRRFHAQPIACPECGPALSMPLAAAVEVLAGGGILAVKGVGGYHLACRADDEGAVSTLRARKHREDRPFALMVRDVAAARELVELGAAEEALLCGVQRPIVLARRLAGALVAASVAPRSAELGLMLPYSPLHHLLMRDVRVPLVMTSGNASDEPIAYRDEDARVRLAGIADAVLSHDRPIRTRTDDSVARVVRGRPMLLRRSRGYVPEALSLPVGARRPLLAVGAELKSTFCVARGEHAWVSHHIGDLKTFETLESFREGIAHFQTLFDVAPLVVVHDEHPQYLSTQYAQLREGVEHVAVQHHHAHLAAVLAEHGETGPAVGAIYDGAGWGPDGTVWGGEILAGSLTQYERVAHLPEVRLPGGDRASAEPWRMACAWRPGEPLAGIAPERWAAVARMAETGLASPLTTSAGRLFDAVAAICGVRTEVTYEGQAAIELEAAADDGSFAPYAFDGLDPRPALAAIAADIAAGVAVGEVSARFHLGFAEATARACAGAARERGIDTVVLAGGVFANVRLLVATAERLQAGGLRVLTPERLPPGDGAIAYGQAAVAAAREAA